MSKTTRRSAPKGFQVRGLMIDLARMTEKHDFYFTLLERMGAWGLNTLWWHFVDDEGMSLRLDGHPELASKFAFNKREMKRFLDKAGKLGIDVVPEVETLGHGRYVTALPQYAHLADGDPHFFNAICPSNPDTVQLMREIIEEVADIFPSPYFHAGLDEVSITGCKRCDRRSQGKPSWFLYGDHAKAMHGIISAAGKRMIMWADHVQRDPELLDYLPKDIIMAHWQYWTGNINIPSIQRSIDDGRQVVIAPSMLRHSNIVQPDYTDVENTETMVAHARKLGKNVLGISNTLWTPYRVVRDTLWPMIAYTGHMARGDKPDFPAFCQSYARSQFGVGTKAVGAALDDLHRWTLKLGELRSLMPDTLPELYDALAVVSGAQASQRVEALTTAVESLKAARSKVKANRAEWDSLILAGQIALGALANGADFRKAQDMYRRIADRRDRQYEPNILAAELKQIQPLLKACAARTADLVRRLDKDWNRTRFAIDPKKGTHDLAKPAVQDMLLGQMARGARFLKQLDATFSRAVEAYRKGQAPMPGMLG